MATSQGMPEDVMKQAQHFWSMLDELAKTDGDAYKKFIEQNLQRGREEMAPPTPWRCLRTHLQSPGKGTLYINICAWSRISKPKCPAEPIKVAAGPLEDGKDEEGAYKVTRVAFSPDVLEECGQNSKELDLLIGNAIDYLQEQKVLRIARSYRFCPGAAAFKGDPAALRDFFGSRLGSPPNEGEGAIGDLTPDALLSRLRVSDDGGGDDRPGGTPGLAVPTADGPGSDRPSARLIEEVASFEADLPRPEADLSLRQADAKRPRRLIGRIDLPGVRSVADCELDITESDISLLVPDKFRLHLPLPEDILKDVATAKFNADKSLLTVTMPTETSGR